MRNKKAKQTEQANGLPCSAEELKLRLLKSLLKKFEQSVD